MDPGASNEADNTNKDKQVQTQCNSLLFPDTAGLTAHLTIDPTESVLCFPSMLFLPGAASLFAVVQYLYCI